MGQGDSKPQRNLEHAIITNSTAKVSELLKADPELAKITLCNGLTNPICRAVYNNFRNIVALLLQNGADVN